MRILHLPANPADQAGIIVRELRKLGYDAALWHYGPSPFGFPADRFIDIEKHDYRILWEAFNDALGSFDVFHFHFGLSFFPYVWDRFPPYWDLPVLRMLGKKIFFTFVGSDVRTRAEHAAQNPYSDFFYEDFAPDEDRIAKRVRIARTYADACFVMSVELMPYVPGASLMPRAFPLDDWAEPPISTREVPRIVHIPSRKSLKGTKQIVEGMHALEREGFAFEFQLLEGVSHNHMREVLVGADVVVDNIVMGDHGIASVEAMASSRVAVAYMNERVVASCPDIPIYNVNPDTFVDRMRQLIVDRSLRQQLGSTGRSYVRDNWDAPKIARKHLEAYAVEPRVAAPFSFPDWASLEDRRRLEYLEQRLQQTEERRDTFNQRFEETKHRLDQAQVLNKQLRARLERAERYSLTRFVPRKLLRRLRARKAAN